MKFKKKRFGWILLQLNKNEQSQKDLEKSHFYILFEFGNAIGPTGEMEQFLPEQNFIHQHLVQFL